VTVRVIVFGCTRREAQAAVAELELLVQLSPNVSHKTKLFIGDMRRAVGLVESPPPPRDIRLRGLAGQSDP
jgi:hypothetical protein